MKTRQIIILSILVTLIHTSCYQMAFRSLGVLEDAPPLKKLANNHKEIVFIPMHHIGKPVFYKNVRHKIDSLRNASYILYYEGVTYHKNNDSMNMDTATLKIRKVLGLDMKSMRTNGGYIDTVNHTLSGRKIKVVSKYKMVNQPRSAMLYDTLQDRKVDVYLSDLLLYLEEKLGKVALTDCDFNTKNGEKYSCKKFNYKKGKKLMMSYRNNFIANEIIKDEHRKIVLIYGAMHFKGILEELQKQDSSWQQIKN